MYLQIKSPRNAPPCRAENDIEVILLHIIIHYFEPMCVVLTLIRTHNILLSNLWKQVTSLKHTEQVIYAEYGNKPYTSPVRSHGRGAHKPHLMVSIFISSMLPNMHIVLSYLVCVSAFRTDILRYLSIE